MVLSASGIVAEQVNGDKYYFFKRQVLFALLGGILLWGAALLPRDWLYKMQYPALFLALLLLLVTLSPLAPAINGAKRWIRLGPVGIQPDVYKRQRLTAALLPPKPFQCLAKMTLCLLPAKGMRTIRSSRA